MSRLRIDRWTAALRRLASRWSSVSTSTLEHGIAERVRLAKFQATARSSPVMLIGNLVNVAVIVTVAWDGGDLGLALTWGAVVILFLRPLAQRWNRTARPAAASSVSPRKLWRATRNAALMGLHWSLAPLLFIHCGEGPRLVVGMVMIGMACGGAFGMATLPLAVAAYTIPMGAGYLVALFLSPAHLHFLLAPLTIAFIAVLIGVSVSHSRSLVESVVAQARAERAARHDPITGLPNRVELDAALAASFARLERYAEPFALLLIRFETLKSLIYEWGPSAGDDLLRQAAVRLHDLVDERGALARIGDDEFALVTRLSADTRDPRALAADIGASFDDAFGLESGLATCRARVSVALAPQDARDPQALLAAATTGNFNAEPGMAANGTERARAPRRRELTSEMRRSLARGEFFLRYQPIAQSRSGRIVGFEALARWRHPRHGLVPPLEFIDIAEKTGLIHELGEWILNEAMREAASWPEPARISINVSGEQLCDVSFEEMFDRALAASGLDPRRVQIEVTESASLAAIDKATVALQRLDARGVEIVLDDFGVGYSSLQQIGRLPIRRLKIDRDFVKGLPLERRDAAIVQSVIGLARALEMSVTAEGVETEAQRAYLELAGADCLQGYLIAKPLDAADAHARLVQQMSAAA